MNTRALLACVPSQTRQVSNMKILIAYATSEGQTRKIARHAAHHLAESGHAVELLALSDASPGDLAHYDRVILAASVHVGHYQNELADFVHDARDILSDKSTLFLSVSLAAAGHDAEDWQGLDRILSDFSEATGWTPERTEQIAGAYLPGRYDMFRRFVMRRIIARKDPGADLDNDIEYTDWAALTAALDAWLKDGSDTPPRRM